MVPLTIHDSQDSSNLTHGLRGTVGMLFTHGVGATFSRSKMRPGECRIPSSRLPP